MVSPMLIAGSIAGCDIVTRAAISGKWKFEPEKNGVKPGKSPSTLRTQRKTWIAKHKKFLGVLCGLCLENLFDPPGTMCTVERLLPVSYFFNVCARKSVVRFQASAASSGR